METLWFNHHRPLWDLTEGAYAPWASVSPISPRRWSMSPKGGREDRSSSHARTSAGKGPARERSARGPARRKRAEPDPGKHDPQGRAMSMRELRASADATTRPDPRVLSEYRLLGTPPGPFRSARARPVPLQSVLAQLAAPGSGSQIPPQARPCCSRRRNRPAGGLRASRRRLERTAAPVGSGARGLNGPRRAGGWQARQKGSACSGPEPEVEPGCG